MLPQYDDQASLLSSTQDGSTTGLSRPALFAMHFRRMAFITVALPFTAFLFCIGFSYHFNFDQSTGTHCNVYNFAPSISSAIGVYKPQCYIWRIAIALHSAPRLIIAKMYREYNKRGVRNQRRNRLLVDIAFATNVIENFTLLGLSFAPSKGDFLLHKICFCTFVVAYILYAGLTILIEQPSRWGPAKTAAERFAYQLKRRIYSVSLSTILLAGYFYNRHNRYCEPYVYSMFSICEYVIVLSNIAFHATAYYDFNDRKLIL